MSVTINFIKVDYNAIPTPTVEFLQGRDMDVKGIRDTLRLIEQSDEGILDEGSPDLNGFIVKSSGNEFFNEAKGERNPMTVTILDPFVSKFQPGVIPFVTSGGNILSRYLNSPGAIVQINNASGAISVNSKDIEHSSFNNGVTIDVVNGVSGTDGTKGNERQPVNNISDAKNIMAARGLRTIYVIGDITFGSTDDISNFKVIGVGTIAGNTFTVVSGCLTQGTHFESCHLQGVLTGNINARDIVFLNTIGIGYDSILIDCIFEGNVGFSGIGTLNIINGKSGLSTGHVEMDWVGVPVANANINGWFGPLGISGVTNGTVSISMAAGSLHVHSSNTGGSISVFPESISVYNQSNGTTILGGTLSGIIIGDPGNTQLTFKTDLKETSDNHWKDAILRFTTGVLNGQVKKISAYNGTTKFITVSAPFTSAPGSTDIFERINK